MDTRNLKNAYLSRKSMKKTLKNQHKQDASTQIDVKRLCSFNESSNKKSFKLGAIPNSNEKLYNPHFRAKNIDFGGFGFRKTKHVLGKNTKQFS